MGKTRFRKITIVSLLDSTRIKKSEKRILYVRNVVFLINLRREARRYAAPNALILSERPYLHIHSSGRPFWHAFFKKKIARNDAHGNGIRADNGLLRPSRCHERISPDFTRDIVTISPYLHLSLSFSDREIFPKILALLPPEVNSIFPLVRAPFVRTVPRVRSIAQRKNGDRKLTSSL